MVYSPEFLLRMAQDQAIKILILNSPKNFVEMGVICSFLYLPFISVSQICFKQAFVQAYDYVLKEIMENFINFILFRSLEGMKR